VILGGLAQIYVIIIGGQAYRWSFSRQGSRSRIFDGVIANLCAESAGSRIGRKRIALALVLTAVALKVLPLLPRSLADRDVAAVPPGNA